MILLQDSAEAINLLNRGRKTSVDSNIYLWADEYKSLISAAKLSYLSSDHYLLLLEERDHYRKLYFQLQATAQKADLPADLPLSTEIVYREHKSIAALSHNFLLACGFQVAERFIRMSAAALKSEKTTLPCHLKISEGREEEAFPFFSNYFSPLAGNMPASGRWQDILVAKADAEIVGALHYQKKTKTTLLLAVKREFRHQGIATALFAEYLKNTRHINARHKIWLAAENRNALMLYGKLGFSVDGFCSQMYIKN